MSSIVLPMTPASEARPLAWVGGNMPAARWGLILNLLVPLVFLTWDALHGMLGADPVNYALHTTGLTSVTFLLFSLAVTPARMITGWTWLVQFRRSLGVYAFYYAIAHLAIYFWWDRNHNLPGTVYEITHRFYLLLGFTSLVLMAPLWATSFNAAIQAMGATWWKRLHRLAYLAAALGCYHFYLQSKADKRRPEVYIAILAGLLLWRIGAAALKRWRFPAKALGATAGASAPLKARFWKGDLKVIGMFRETETVRTFRLAPADGGPIPFAFRAGQFLNLMVVVDGKWVGRSYTIASSPTREGYVELTIKREANGQVSRFLHDKLMTGEGVAISAPAGRFHFDFKKNEAVLLIAGGVGITPLMSIVRDLTDRCWPGRIDLLFSVRTESEIIFREELRHLQSRHPNLHVHVTITGDAAEGWAGLRGRITGDLLKRHVPDVAQRPAFLCGPDAMVAAAREELVVLGLRNDQITFESFTPRAAANPEHPTDPAAGLTAGETATVTFARSGKAVALEAGKTILDAAEAIGVSIDYQCRSGICGTCRCKLLRGQVTMLMRDALSDADESEGFILACQAHASEDVTVDA